MRGKTPNTLTLCTTEFGKKYHILKPDADYSYCGKPTVSIYEPRYFKKVSSIQNLCQKCHSLWQRNHTV